MTALAPKSYTATSAPSQAEESIRVPRGTGTYSEGARRIASDGPSPAAVKRCTLFEEDAYDAAAAERLWVDLALDLEGVQWEQDDLADTGQAARGGLHHHLALALAECAREVRLVVPGEDVVEPWLSAELVDPLRDLVACCISKPREEREQLAS